MTKKLRLRGSDGAWLTALGFAAAGLVVLAHFMTMSRVVTVNGLGVPVEVIIDGEARVVPVDRELTVRVRQGVHRAVFRVKGKVVDEAAFATPGIGVVILNPLGAAPVYEETITYTRAGMTPVKPSDPIFFGGRTASVVRGSVDDLLADPPRTMSTKGSTATRRHVGKAEGGVELTVSFLERHGDRDRAAATALAVLDAAEGIERERAFSVAYEMAFKVGGPESALALATSERAKDPGNGRASSAWASLMEELGRGDEVVAALSAARRDAPDDPRVQLAWARVAPRAEARTLYDQLVAAHPDDAKIGISAAAFALDDGRPEDAVKLFTRFTSDPRSEEATVYHAHAIFLASGQAAAFRFVADRISQRPAVARDDGAVCTALALAVSADERRRASSLLNKERYSEVSIAVRLAEAGHTVTTRPTGEGAGALRIVEETRLSAAAGLRAWQAVGEDVRSFVPFATRAVLAAEGLRTGMTDPPGVAFGIPWTEAAAYVRGGPVPARLFRVLPPARVALELARRAELLQQGQRADVEEAAVRRHALPGSPAARLLAPGAGLGVVGGSVGGGGLKLPPPKPKPR